MNWPRTRRPCFSIGAVFTLAALLTATVALRAADPATIRFHRGESEVKITAGDEPIATYVFRDPAIPRPYFCQVFAPGGVQVTRHHPPRAGMDAMDHDQMHPGIWMAFGDVSGQDYWRLKSTIKHDQFVGDLVSGPGKGAFVVRDQYLVAGSGEPLGQAETRYTVMIRPHAYLLTIDSTFSTVGDRAYYFGDQEEMGVGIRVATPLTVVNGGKMVNSEGGINEKEIWGRTADWCDYSGPIDGRSVGMTIMADPGNFRPSWMHARNYGFIAANPFGVRSFTRGATNQTWVRPGAPLRLRYGILIHAAPHASAVNLAEEFRLFAESRSSAGK